jgi:hypothetical protein
VFDDGRVEQIFPDIAKGGNRASFVLAHHSRVAGQIGCENGGKAALRAEDGHERIARLGSEAELYFTGPGMSNATAGAVKLNMLARLALPGASPFPQDNLLYLVLVRYRDANAAEPPLPNCCRSAWSDKAENRCLAPSTWFAEPENGRGSNAWFETGGARTVFFAALFGFGRSSVRKLKDGKKTDHLFAFLTPSPNTEVAKVHPMAVPVIQMEPRGRNTWLAAGRTEAKTVPRP